MLRRFRGLPPERASRVRRLPRRMIHAVPVGLPIVLLLGLSLDLPALAAPNDFDTAAPHEPSIPGVDAKPLPRAASVVDADAAKPGRAVTWPAGGTAAVDLPERASGGAASAGAASA